MISPVQPRFLSIRRRIRSVLLTVVSLLVGLSTQVVHSGIPEDLELIEVLSGFNRPIAVRHAGDGSGRLFVAEQNGIVWVWDGASAPTVFLDIVDRVDSGANEQGLLGIDFHPDYDSNGFFYLNFTRDPGPGLDRTTVARFSVSAGDPDVADASSSFTIIEIEQDFSNHNGGNILFGPDGFLYIGMGDGGSGRDPLNRSQDVNSLLGKMLRIDVDGSGIPGGELCGLVQNYTIPADNAYPGIGNGCDEIYAVGLRNPWRWSFDRLTGDMFIGDVGQSSMEEISFQSRSTPAGVNFGWSCMEGNETPGFNPCIPGAPLTNPIWAYSRSGGHCSVTGGYRYRGAEIPGLVGQYVYGDFCSATIWFLTESQGVWSSEAWDPPGVTLNSVASFGEDEEGRIYVIDLGGSVYRFEPSSLVHIDGFEAGGGAGR